MRKLVLIIASLLPTMVWAQSIEAVVDTIIAHSTALQLAHQQGMTALSEVRAESGLEPTEIEYSPFFTRGMSGMASSELIVSQSLRSPWAYAQSGRLARKIEAANDAALEALIQDTRIAARSLCLEVVGLNRTIAIRQQRMGIADSLLVLYESGRQRGAMTALDVNRIRMERMDVQATLLEAQAARDKAMHRLREMAGGREVSLQGIGLPEMADVNVPATTTDLRIEAAQRQVDVARQREKAVRADWLPSLKVGYRRNTDGGVASHGILIGGSIPLFGAGRARAVAHRRQQEAVTQAQITQAAIERERMDLKTELQLAHDRLRAIDTTIVQETLQMLRRSLSAGQISLVEYLTSAAPLYEKLEDRIATLTILHQTYTALQR